MKIESFVQKDIVWNKDMDLAIHVACVEELYTTHSIIAQLADAVFATDVNQGEL